MSFLLRALASCSLVSVLGGCSAGTGGAEHAGDAGPDASPIVFDAGPDAAACNLDPASFDRSCNSVEDCTLGYGGGDVCLACDAPYLFSCLYEPISAKGNSDFSQAFQSVTGQPPGFGFVQSCPGWTDVSCPALGGTLACVDHVCAIVPPDGGS